MKAAASVSLLLLSSVGQTVGLQAQVAPQQTTPPATPAQATPGANAPAQTQTNSQAQVNGGSQTNPTAPAAKQAVQNDTTGQPGLPQAPEPKLTEPLFLLDTPKNYTHLKRHSFKDPFAPYTPTFVPLPSLGNTPRLDNLLRDGKLYLSLADAVTLALREQLRHCDCADQPGYRGYGYSCGRRRDLRFAVSRPGW